MTFGQVFVRREREREREDKRQDLPASLLASRLMYPSHAKQFLPLPDTGSALGPVIELKSQKEVKKGDGRLNYDCDSLIMIPKVTREGEGEPRHKLREAVERDSGESRDDVRRRRQEVRVARPTQHVLVKYPVRIIVHLA